MSAYFYDSTNKKKTRKINNILRIEFELKLKGGKGTNILKFYDDAGTERIRRNII